MVNERRCNWMDSETEVCGNSDCPMYCGCCPVPGNLGVCGYEDRSGTQPQREVERVVPTDSHGERRCE